MKKNCILSAAALGIFVFAANSQALVITGGSFNNTQSTTEIIQTGILGLFDSSLGTLNSVNFSFTGAGTTSFSLNNAAAQAQRVKVDSAVNLFYGSSNGGIDALLQSLSQPLVILNFSTGLQNITPGQTLSFGPFSDSQSASALFTSGLTAFQQAGGGNFSITCESLSGITVTGGGGNVNSTQNTIAGCGASISYDYTASSQPQGNVPEPTAIGLIGLGFSALGFRKKIQG